MENFSSDAYTPKEIAQQIEQFSVSKSVLDPYRVFALSLLAGHLSLLQRFFIRWLFIIPV